MSKLDYCNVALAGLTRCDLDRLQSVINIGARPTVGAQHYDHISPLLVDLHWLLDGRTYTVKLCVLVYRCLHGSVPCYLQQTVCPVASMESRRRLRSVTSSDLMVPATRRSTLGDRAFAVAGPRAFNNLSGAIRHSPSLETFKRSLKSHLFLQCFCLVLVSQFFLWLWLCTAPLKWLRYLRHSRNWLFYITLHYIAAWNTDRRRGVALIHHESIKATTVDVSDYSEF